MLEINASITSHNNTILCAYRTDHLYQFDSKSFITELDQNFNIVSTIPLKAENGNTAFEDVRLLSTGKNLLAFYTYFPFDGHGGWKWQYGVGCGYVNTKTGLIYNQQSLRGFSKRYHEKNWCPYIVDNEIFLVTDWEPYLRILRLGKIDEVFEISEFYISSDKTAEWSYGELRGGTPLLSNPNRADGWYYGFIHSYRQNYKGFARYYFYTIARIRHTTKKIEYYPFRLTYTEPERDEIYYQLWQISNGQTLKVIFPIGIMSYDNGILLSAGVDDVCSIIDDYSWAQIEGFFKNEGMM